MTIKDVDFDSSTLNINKSLQRIGKEDIITIPKTAKSNRTVVVTKFLLELIVKNVRQRLSNI